MHVCNPLLCCVSVKFIWTHASSARVLLPLRQHGNSGHGDRRLNWWRQSLRHALHWLRGPLFFFISKLVLWILQTKTSNSCFLHLILRDWIWALTAFLSSEAVCLLNACLQSSIVLGVYEIIRTHTGSAAAEAARQLQSWVIAIWFGRGPHFLSWNLFCKFFRPKRGTWAFCIWSCTEKTSSIEKEILSDFTAAWQLLPDAS